MRDTNMRIGIVIGGSAAQPEMDQMIQRAQAADVAGIHSVWFAHFFAYDAMTLASAIARETTRIALGTAVVPTYPRHPIAMAQQALTVQAASKGRFNLGIGPSHKPIIEGAYGGDYSRPLTHLREYCAVVKPLLNGEPVDHRGEQYSTAIGLSVADAAPVPLLVSALGPNMLDFAGRETDGTIAFLADDRVLRDHVIPRISAAAKGAGRPDPRVLAIISITLTDDAEGARKDIAEALSSVPEMDSYKTMLARTGASGPADLALVGNAQQLRDHVRRYEDVGVTELVCGVFAPDAATHDRTLDFLASLV